MITRRVTLDGREAVIPLTLLRDPGDETRSLEALIDTGFTGHLTLPPDIVEELGLQLRGAAEVILADGSVETLPIYRIRLIWHGQERAIRAYAAPGDPLVAWRYSPGANFSYGLWETVPSRSKSCDLTDRREAPRRGRLTPYSHVYATPDRMEGDRYGHTESAPVSCGCLSGTRDIERHIGRDTRAGYSKVTA